MSSSTPKSQSSSVLDRLSPLERSRLETLIAERNRRQNRERAEQFRGDFAAFIRPSWNIVDPAMPLIDNWHIDALAEHLQAIAERVDVPVIDQRHGRIDDV